MFIGHFGVGFGAKKIAPTLSLGYLFIAAQFLDLLWPILLLCNIEHVQIAPGITKMTPLDFTDYPISHSLLTVIGWGCLLGLACRILTKNSRLAWIVGACVVSHWVLDLLMHRPDLPLFPGDAPKLGLGIWNFPVATLFLEAAFFSAGLALYMSATKPKNRKGSYGLAFLAGFLLVSYVASVISPPPPNLQAIGWGSLAQWIFVVLAFWVDSHRTENKKGFEIEPLT